MSAPLKLFSFLLVMGCLAMMAAFTEYASAVGAPTENYTIPDIPTSDPLHNEIKPPVSCILTGPTSQADNSTPDFIPDFHGPDKDNKYMVTGSGNWYLNIDINVPGWIYIYEYYLSGGDYQGGWIAYKWHMPQSGNWKLGPFSPSENEPEGKHIYRIWFYSEGLWAADDPLAPQGNLVQWTYLKTGAPAAPEEPPAAPVKEDTFYDQLYKFITSPAVLAVGIPVIAAIVLAGIYSARLIAARRDRRIPEPLLLKEPAPFSGTAVKDSLAMARLTLPNGQEIRINATSRIIGRSDLARVLDLDDLALISRHHFELESTAEGFFINDTGSSNGTRLNGTEIRGNGPAVLRDGDIIEPGGAVQIKFHEL
jgi:hypothetical protein